MHIMECAIWDKMKHGSASRCKDKIVDIVFVCVNIIVAEPRHPIFAPKTLMLEFWAQMTRP